MRAQIQKILEMNKAGQLDDEQAAQMIAELKPPASGGATPGGGRGRGWIETLTSPFRGAASSVVTGVFPSELKDNSVSMSRVDVSSDAACLFKDNSISMSEVTALALARSEMTENAFSSAKVDRLELTDSVLSRCGIRATAFERVTLGHARMTDVDVQSSRCEGWSLSKGSQVLESKVYATVTKDWELMEGSTLQAVDLSSSQVVKLRLIRSTLADAMLRTIRVVGLTVQDSELRDILVSGGEGWKKSGFENVTFESCRIDKAIFAECRFKNVTLRNLTLSHVKAMNVNLTDQVIDGNEVFDRIVAATRAG